MTAPLSDYSVEAQPAREDVANAYQMLTAAECTRDDITRAGELLRRALGKLLP